MYTMEKSDFCDVCLQTNAIYCVHNLDHDNCIDESENKSLECELINPEGLFNPKEPDSNTIIVTKYNSSSINFSYDLKDTNIGDGYVVNDPSSGVTTKSLDLNLNESDSIDISYKVSSNKNFFTTKLGREKKVYTCKVCGKVFSQKSHFLAHGRTHTKERPHTCGVCNKSFAEMSNLIRHSIIHSDEKPHTCDVCNKSFSLKTHLTRHYNLIHTSQKVHSCDICGKKFFYSKDLMRHALVHTEDRSYLCNLCNKHFKRPESLARHHLTHSGDKPYSCSFCGKSFALKNRLTVHLRGHSEDKPFSCPVCGKGFVQQCLVSRHFLLQHTNEKPYACDYCDKSFSLRYRLKNHMLTHEKVDSVKLNNLDKQSVSTNI